MDYFVDMIGQDGLKRKLSFYLDAYAQTRRVPFLMFQGPRGVGKSAFMERFARNLLKRDGSLRPIVSLNSSIIKNNKTFFESIFLQFINGNEVTVLFDECHNLPNDFAQALLTICNSDPDPVRHFQYEDMNCEFDFTKISFLFATTESDKIFPPLKDRMEIVDFDGYKQSELRRIIELNADGVVFDGRSLDLIQQNVRGNARSCVKMAENIVTYCKKIGKPVFTCDDWSELKTALNILPLGLTNSEIQILRELNTRGACTLNMLASSTGLSKRAIQMDHEQHLIKNALIKIDIKRFITQRGQAILAVI